MAEFEYKAKDRDGRPVTGRIEAIAVDEAIARLSEQGFSARREDVMLLVGHDEERAPRLTGRDTAELVETIVGLTQSNLPLSAGLRAAAEEIPQRRVATAMRRVAAGLDRGVSLDEALSHSGRGVPNHLRGLILAGLRTGRVAQVLEELVAMDQEQVDLQRRIVAALTYPTILFVLLIAGFMVADLYVVGPFARLFEEFGMELPTLTRMAFSMMDWLDRSGSWSLPIVFGILLVAFVILLLIPKPPELQRACYRFPIIGPLWRWQSLVDFSRLMHLLLDRRIPIPEALRLTAAGLRWSDLAEVSRACAVDIEKGTGLSEAMAKYREFPASIHPVIASGLKAQQPAEAFDAAADMYRRRAGVDVSLWEAILPPMILVVVAGGFGFLILATILPMIKLISSLT